MIMKVASKNNNRYVKECQGPKIFSQQMLSVFGKGYESFSWRRVVLAWVFASWRNSYNI